MPEPTSFAAGAITTASALTLAVLGVDYYSLIWSLVGTFGALYWREQRVGSIRSVLYVALSTLVGAAIGTALMAGAGSTSRPILILLSLVCGFGAQAILTALLEAGLERIKRRSDSLPGGDK